MYFSVVIPTYNRLDMLVRVLDALDAQVDAPPFEVIVINDGSKDDTEHVISQRKGIVFRTQANAGPGRARNHGVSLARGKIVVFIGDDTVPEPRFLFEHARVHRESSDDPMVACLGYTGWPRGERIYSRDTLGATDGGSSGSPIVNASNQVVGQLSGACGFDPGDPCNSEDNATVDGALAFYWNTVQPFLAP